MSISVLIEAVEVGGFGGDAMVAYSKPQRRTDLGLPPVDAAGPLPAYPAMSPAAPTS